MPKFRRIPKGFDWNPRIESSGFFGTKIVVVDLPSRVLTSEGLLKRAAIWFKEGSPYGYGFSYRHAEIEDVGWVRQALELDPSIIFNVKRRTFTQDTRNKRSTVLCVSVNTE